MKAKDQLTIILPLKGRHRYTYRWLDYAKRINCPFSIYIADGSIDDDVSKYLFDNKEEFESLNITYKKYNFDESYFDFYKKMIDSLKSINTPYVVMVDNDDYFMTNGLFGALRFLNKNSDYIACAGRIGSFEVFGGDEERVTGNSIKVFLKPYVGQRSIDQEDVESRVNEIQSHGYLCSFYDVYRKEVLLNCFEFILKCKVLDFYFLEVLMMILPLYKGKRKNLNDLFLMRQTNTLGSSASVSPRISLIDKIFTNEWRDQLVKINELAIEDNLNFNNKGNVVESAIKLFTMRKIFNDINSNVKNSRKKFLIKLNNIILKLLYFKEVAFFKKNIL